MVLKPMVYEHGTVFKALKCYSDLESFQMLGYGCLSYTSVLDIFHIQFSTTLYISMQKNNRQIYWK